MKVFILFLYYLSFSIKEGVRIESGVREKDSISVFYDPMIAKLITWGKDREEAMTKMHDSLAQYRVISILLMFC